MAMTTRVKSSSLTMGTKWCTNAYVSDVLAWLAIKGVIVNVEKIMSVIVKT
jgi:hypothetical protein